jgi:cobaltochelatase CobS
MDTEFQSLLDQQKALLEVAIQQAVQKAVEDVKLTKKSISPELFLELANMAQANMKIAKPEKVVNIPVQTKADLCESNFQITREVVSMLTDLYLGNNVYLFGLAGTGKSYTAKKIAGLMGRKPYLINCSQWTSPTIIIGGQTIEGYREGQLIKAWQNGGMLILDELPKLDPNTAGLLNDALSMTGNKPEICDISEFDYSEAIANESVNGKDAQFDFLTAEETLAKGLIDEIIEGQEYYRITYPTITNGMGEVIRKNEGFCVIATGNTDMQTPSASFGGNNKQDYSLIDRFAGSYYRVGYDEATEARLNYAQVFNICQTMRNVISNYQIDQAITLRTMLNFSRIYENQMLRYLEVPDLGWGGVQVEGQMRPVVKTLRESVESFLEVLPKDVRAAIETTNVLTRASQVTDLPERRDFLSEFKRMYGIDLTQEPYNVYLP